MPIRRVAGRRTETLVRKYAKDRGAAVRPCTRYGGMIRKFGYGEVMIGTGRGFVRLDARVSAIHVRSAGLASVIKALAQTKSEVLLRCA